MTFKTARIDLPGPGEYNGDLSPTKPTTKVARLDTRGHKIQPLTKDQINGPGPSNYKGDHNKIKTSASKANMGSNARPDNFTNKH